MRPWERLLAAFFRALFRRSVVRGLRGVWVRGELPGQACVLAGNHHSWWDSYLLPVLFWSEKVSFKIMVGERRLQEFAFFRHLDTVSAARPRDALRVLGQGEVLVVFPEGELRPPGALGELNKGVVWFAEKAGVPLVPVASRVALRGHEFAEAYLVFGEPLGPDLNLLHEHLKQMLTELDQQIRTAPAEEPLPGFELRLAGRKSTHERMAVWGAALGKLTGGR
ncbi:lysophospholipid acyltransferase family protein [Meiothermus hypogaeus]|uniref:1-acyl-sn-glycerol-3-phosphate acyltransferase n=2 Tax=Meiothermus hypogaeus TaxID=884155 RepID=A0A511R0A0_9DEIN|nr:lysophospholipid acyltransferase family protein [Meiothermus hypogaeus]RIH75345.1 Bifunctional protein Aas [Meiothermus hypogaeus]GEM83049.1 1-acyl-sn-glycerol-3-phosphate acyltransferase [Meiothermus hypogaeus NBRC 106114]GIW37288.1 MAG: 1-acyl-sn-glycerol-3-phosphate acyltransferase [Meiothermus sp.]